MAWTSRWATIGGAVLAIATFGGCGGEDEDAAEPGPAATEPAQGQTQPAPAGTSTQAEGGGDREGRQIFVSTCGACHTLADAGTDGKVGPDLDAIKPDEQRVLTAMKEGPGVMPANILEGARAATVAKYVASVAGR